MPITLPEVNLSAQPNRIVLLFDGPFDSADLATEALDLARRRMPKVTGYAANSLLPVHGPNYFGINFIDRVWFLERGISPFTMTKLHGVIPMWIDDPTGQVRKENPKAKTRVTKDGRTQVKIFRYASKAGARKTVLRRGANGLLNPVTVPRSYPGAPGRIARRQPGQPLTAAGRQPGQIARNNVGVRWRHPGTVGRMFLNSAIADTALAHGIELRSLYVCDDATFFSLVEH